MITRVLMLGARVSVGDFDGDGRPEVTMGGKGGGFFFVYDWCPQRRAWKRHSICSDISPQVGATAVDIDGDGIDEVVCGEWGPNLYHFKAVQGDLSQWQRLVVYTGLNNPHDVLSAALKAPGSPDVVVREKDGCLMVFHPERKAEGGLWTPTILANHLAGDGTAAGAVRNKQASTLDLITNCGWWENAAGDASVWVPRPLLPGGWDFHPEKRVAFGDVYGNGSTSVVITESEIPDARMAVLTYAGPDRPWEVDLVIDRHECICAMHSLQLADVDGDGKLEIITLEMENGRTDGVRRRPRWWMLKHSSVGWEKHLLLDQNLGGHAAVVADFNGDGKLEIVSKVWRANRINGAQGNNHVDHGIFSF